MVFIMPFLFFLMQYNTVVKDYAMKTFKYVLFCFLGGITIQLLTLVIMKLFLKEFTLVKLLNIYFYEGSLLIIAGLFLQFSALKFVNFEHSLLKYYPVKTKDVSKEEFKVIPMSWTLIITGISVYIILLILHLILRPV